MNYMISIKVFVAAIICSPIIGKIIFFVYKGKIPHRGSIIEVPKDVDPTICALLFWGLYESQEIRFVKKYLLENTNVIELGSSLGGVSCELLKKLSIETRLLCLEANMTIFNLLKKNVIRQSGIHNCEFINAAIDYSGIDEVNICVGNNNLKNSITNVNLNNNTSVISAITLSKILEISNFSDFILISDIEGAELGIMLYDLEALRNCKQMIIELHETNLNGVLYSVQDIVDLIVKGANMTILDSYDDVYIFNKITAEQKK